MKRLVACWAVSLVVLAGPVVASAETVGSAENPFDVSAEFYSGWLTGEKVGAVRVQGEKVVARMGDGWLAGVRLGLDEVYYGFEVGAAGVFSDLDLSHNPAAAVPSAGDANMFLLDVNLLLYPFGDFWSEGRIRPYVTVGPGMAYLDTDFEPLGDDVFLDLNVGAGSKFLLGDQGNPILRVEYRWHRIVGHGDWASSINTQEITAAIGFRF